MKTVRPSVLLLFLIFSSFLSGGEFIVKPSESWVELPFTHDITEGSILDFSSFLNDAPAGKHGFIKVGKSGHFEFENNPGKPVRFVGTNLCYGANYLSKEQADTLARRFQLMGYNSVRFHHYDVDLLKGNWNAKASDDIDPAKLDQLDYLFAAMKKAGMYITIDLMSSRGFAKGEIEGYDKACRWEFKAVFPIVPGAFDAWSKFALKLLNHKNPYTGLTWKEDPALITICPLNEDSIISVWGNKNVKHLYISGFETWMEEKQQPLPERKNYTKSPFFAQYLTEVKMASNRKLTAFFKENGVKAMITGSNWYDTMLQTFPRSEFDYVDNHLYADHPWGWPEQGWNQNNSLGSGNRRYIMPIYKMPTRIFGKPFTVSEYNWCPPNMYRCEGGAMMGGYSALQNWDAIYRFAWAHAADTAINVKPMHAFDSATDPLSILTEKQIMLLYGRGDVSPARKRYVYLPTLQESTEKGLGNMWSKGLFPAEFNAMGLVSQIGSAWLSGTDNLQVSLDGAVSLEKPENLEGIEHIQTANLPLPGYPVSKAKGEVVSDTGEVILNNKNTFIKIITSKTECITAAAKQDLTADMLSVSHNDSYSSISASSMDENPLSSSSRILLIHLTNVLSSNESFQSNKMKKFVKGKKWKGSLPHLVKAGKAIVSLKNSNPDLKLFAIDFSGKQIKEVQTEYKDETYSFQADTALNGMIYELVKVNNDNNN